MDDAIIIRSERLTAEEYIDFLKRTDLGSQYPRERFEERIARLVNAVSVSLTARDADNLLVGVLFGLTDFAYWLYVTDLGIDRRYTRRGIGRRLMRTAHEMAGGERDDDRGRHTTTHRELIILPGGVTVIDTPGMRELGMWDAGEGLSAAFSDIHNYIFTCKINPPGL